MKLSDLKENDRQLAELLPALGAVAGGIGKAVGGIAQAAGAATQGFKAGMTGAPLTPGAKPTSGQPAGGLDPAQAALAAKEQQEKKKEVQNAIKQKQQELSDLQKQLAQLG